MTNQTHKRKLLNENLNAVHDRLEVILDATQSLQDARRRIKAALVLRTIVEKLEELDLLLDQRK